MRNATVHIPIGMTADADAVVPWLTRHNVTFCETVILDEDTERWLLECSCGEFVEFDRLLSRLMNAYDIHRGTPARESISIGKLTREI